MKNSRFAVLVCRAAQFGQNYVAKKKKKKKKNSIMYGKCKKLAHFAFSNQTQSRCIYKAFTAGGS